MILIYKITPKIKEGREKVIIPIRNKLTIGLNNYYSKSYASITFKYHKKYNARLFPPNPFEGEDQYYIKVKPNNYNKFIKITLETCEKYFYNV